MKITDKITNKEITVENPNTIQQLQKFFGCDEPCLGRCMEAMKLEVRDKYSNRRKLRKLCEILFK